MLSGSDYLPMETCFYILPAPVSLEDRQWLTDGSTPAAEMMQSCRDNWRAARSRLMETHFANLSGGCDVRVAAVSQSNTVFRAFFLFSSSSLCWGLIRRSRTNPPCFDYDSALRVLRHTAVSACTHTELKQFIFHFFSFFGDHVFSTTWPQVWVSEISHLACVFLTSSNSSSSH